MKQLFYILIISLFIADAKAQENTLSIDNTLDIVRKYHPVIKQTRLEKEISKNELRSAKGVFDPSIQLNNQEKIYDNKLYYRYNTTELKIPLWYGIDIKAGTENNIGDRIDPSLTKDKNAFLGVSVDPFRGLIVDKRRSIVKQAEKFVELTSNEQQLVVNDLILDASNAYWNWVTAYYTNDILSKSIQNNKDRYEIIKNAFISGDRAPIDTTEALAQLQNLQIMQTQAELDLQKSRLELSNYFWSENGLPYELDMSVLPETSFEIKNINEIKLGNLNEQVDLAIKSHPKLKMIGSKASILDIEKKLKTIELFPSLKLNYNTLDYNLGNITNNINTSNNYKYGLTLSMPLFLRQARGDLAKTKNKIEVLNWDRKYYLLEIENKVKATYADFHSLKQQIKTNELVVNANKLLFDVETTKFKMGESSLFLINSREQKFIETELKNIALKIKFYASINKNLWAMGALN